MSVKRNRQRHREFSREIVKRLGGRYVGGIEGQDVDCDPWSVEVKTRERFAALDWMKQAVKNCPKDRTPILVVHTVSQRIDNALVCFRLKDFEEWFVPAVKP